jgi:hypothetical protein
VSLTWLTKLKSCPFEGDRIYTLRSAFMYSSKSHNPGFLRFVLHCDRTGSLHQAGGATCQLQPTSPLVTLDAQEAVRNHLTPSPSLLDQAFAIIGVIDASCGCRLSQPAPSSQRSSGSRSDIALCSQRLQKGAINHRKRCGATWIKDCFIDEI